jgi:hypothetical protein
MDFFAGDSVRHAQCRPISRVSPSARSLRLDAHPPRLPANRSEKVRQAPAATHFTEAKAGRYVGSVKRLCFAARAREYARLRSWIGDPGPARDRSRLLSTPGRRLHGPSANRSTARHRARTLAPRRRAACRGSRHATDRLSFLRWPVSIARRIHRPGERREAGFRDGGDACTTDPRRKVSGRWLLIPVAARTGCSPPDP